MPRLSFATGEVPSDEHLSVPHNLLPLRVHVDLFIFSEEALMA